MNYRTIAAVCGPRWSRMLPVSHAAAYAGMTEKQFCAVFGELIIDWHGKKAVDKDRLDKEIDLMLYGV